jgi:MFS transporter, DHA1 family, chloramphenicol resistance protein
MPFVVYLLAVAVFAQATSEFMLAGLVPAIAADLAVSPAAAGSLTSAFAAGMVVGAPLTALLARRFAPRVALPAFLVVFAAVHVVGATTGSFAVLAATRVLAALANAGFLAVALSVVVRVVPEGRTGRATSVLLSGTTLACVAGVPAGAALGQALGWRATFWAVALVCLPAIVGVLRGVPRAVPGGPTRPVRGELRVLGRARPLWTLAVGALVNAATFGTFTYLALVLTDGSGLGAGWVPAGLALFGLGSFAGVTVAGRLADRFPSTVVAVGGTLLVAGWVALAVGAGVPAVALVLVAVQGTLSFAVGTTVIARALVESADAPTLGGSYATASLNVGAVLGPAAAGVALGATGSPVGPVWTSAVLAAAGLLTAALSAVAAGGVAIGGVSVTARASRRRPGARRP